MFFQLSVSMGARACQKPRMCENAGSGTQMAVTRGNFDVPTCMLPTEPRPFSIA